MCKKYLMTGLLNHRPEGFDGGPSVVLLQDDHAFLCQMVAHHPEEVLVDLPIWIVRAYVPLILIDEMGWVAHDQVPYFRMRNVFEIIRLINRNAVAELVDAHGVLARRNCCRVNVR